MKLKIDLHIHSSRYSSCSVLSPNQLCQVALDRGLNAVAITEHHHQWSKEEIAALQARYPALKLYAGVEISCTDGHDYVVLGMDAGAYHPHPMSYDKLWRLLDAHPGAFVFIAHCFRFSTDESGLAERAVDGLEMASYNILARHSSGNGRVALAHEQLYHAWQQKMGWTGFYNSDGHSPKMVGTFYNLIETDEIPPHERALIHLLRHARVQGVQNDDLIRASRDRR